MRGKIYNIVSTYTSWIIANYQAIAKINASMPSLRLISQGCNEKTGETYFVVQITGKNVFPKLSLNDFKDSSILANFSKSDQEVICRYLPRKQAIARYIVARTYDREKKQFNYTIESHDQKSNIRKCMITDKLFPLLHDLRSFDEEDAFLIGLESSKIELN